jgi:hypothetical protein
MQCGGGARGCMVNCVYMHVDMSAGGLGSTQTGCGVGLCGSKYSAGQGLLLAGGR